MKAHHISKLHLVFVLLVATVSCMGSPGQHQEGKPHHHTQEGFRNPPGSPPRSFSWHSLWFFPTRPFAQLTYADAPEWHVMPADEALRQFNNAEGKNSVTWIGHMTAVIRLDGQVIAIDPWFTDYATPYPPFGPHRKMPPGIPLEKLPQIDTVVISKCTIILITIALRPSKFCPILKKSPSSSL